MNILCKLGAHNWHLDSKQQQALADVGIWPIIECTRCLQKEGWGTDTLGGGWVQTDRPRTEAPL